MVAKIMTIKNITSVQHPLVKHLVKLRQNRDYRYDHQRLIVDGITLVSELGGSTRFKTIVVRDEMMIPLGVEADEIMIVSENVMKKISGLQSPEGIVAEIGMPKPDSLDGKHYIIALDGVNDPGNVGTLLRSALALGWEGAFILDESCDPFNEKAIRAARGATFRLPLSWGSWEDLQRLIQQNHLTPLIAEISGEKIEDVKIPDSILLILGNEARGVSEKSKQIGRSVTIEMVGEMESLNVAIAGSIIMYTLRSPKSKK